MYDRAAIAQTGRESRERSLRTGRGRYSRVREGAIAEGEDALVGRYSSGERALIAQTEGAYSTERERAL